jgi:hypothetical protein
MIQGYIRLKLLTGMRMTDLLSIQPARDAKEDGIHLQASKTIHSSGVKQIFTWLDKDGGETGRRAAYELCLAARPLDIAPFLFCTVDGTSYLDENGLTTSFNSVWKRFYEPRTERDHSEDAIRRTRPARQSGYGCGSLRKSGASPQTARSRRRTHYQEVVHEKS